MTSRDKQGQSRDKQGQDRDKQGQAGTSMDIPFLSLLVPTCPSLSLPVHACPCLSLSVPVLPCLSLSVPVCLYICYTFMSTPVDEYNSLHQYEHSYIDFSCKSSVPMHAKLVCNFFLTFYLASSITLSGNPNRFILVINIKKRRHLVSFTFFSSSV